MVSAEDAVRILKLISTNSIPVWLTGGWGIDALLGRQTRPHKDLDLVMLLDDVLPLRQLLADHGYVSKTCGRKIPLPGMVPGMRLQPPSYYRMRKDMRSTCTPCEWMTTVMASLPGMKERISFLAGRISQAGA